MSDGPLDCELIPKDYLTFMPATPTRLRAYLMRDYELDSDQAVALMTRFPDEVLRMCNGVMLTHQAGDALQLLNNAV